MHILRSLLLVSLFIVVPAIVRAADHPWNLAPIGALALFTGAYFKNRQAALLVPLAAMFLSDVLISAQRHDFDLYFMHRLTPLVYGCYVLNVLLGMNIRRIWTKWQRFEDYRDVSGEKVATSPTAHFFRRLLPIGASTLTGAAVFFLVTNFGVWAFYPTYAHTLDGLIECYVLAIPFAKSTFISDMVFTAIMFGGFAVYRMASQGVSESSLLYAE